MGRKCTEDHWFVAAFPLGDGRFAPALKANSAGNPRQARELRNVSSRKAVLDNAPARVEVFGRFEIGVVQDKGV